jgi:hypothetical protein
MKPARTIHSKTDWKLARRDLLKQLGVGAACLPLLRATRAEAAPPSKKLMILAASEGYQQSAWRPKDGSLMTQTLPPSCTPLEEHKADLIFLPGMTLPSEGSCNNCGHGAYGVIYWGLPSVNKPSPEYKEPTGPTLDQVVAAGLPPPASGYATLALDVQLAIPPHTPFPGYNHCFWKGAHQPVNTEGNPYKVYGDLFGHGDSGGGGNTDQTVQYIFAQRKSILDFVGTSLMRFRGRLGADDRAIVDGHTSAIRDLEKQLAFRLQNEKPERPGQCGTTAPMTGIDLSNPREYPRVLEPQLDLMITALKCGITQVTTLQLGDATGDNIDFGFIDGMGAGTGYKTKYRNWHDLAHNPTNKQTGKDEKQMTDLWFMNRFSALIAKLKQIDDPAGGKLFDNTLVLWGNNMGQGGAHTSQELPWILAGNCGHYFKTGQCAPSAGKPVTAAMAEICNAMGTPGAQFGMPMPGLKA